MTTVTDISRLPAWFKLLLAIAGILLMLTAIGVIPADPARFHAPRWMLFAAGAAWVAAGVLLSAAEYRATHPARYHFAAGILLTLFFLLAVGAAVYASGSVVGVGPLLIKGAAADKISRIAYGTCAAVFAVLGLGAWRRWWRAARA
jgi:hypothetical protein